ncbi:HNH endonuclease [Salinibacterium sp. SWN248]|uniref:HNH endonuclease n=1 Tax=Salinibacterium sp. SWN248 TaxID=2792056 RepID=UPI0035AC05D2
MTIGHRIAQALGGSDRPDNLRTECSRCNEPRREEGRRPERFDEIFTEIRRFSREDLRTLHQWVVDGQRSRSKVDEIYDRLRSLGHEEQRDAASRIQEMLLGRA